MQLISKVLLAILPVSCVFLVTSSVVQDRFVDDNTRDVVKSDVLTTTKLIQRFVEGGQMDELKDFLKSIDANKNNETNIEKIALFNKDFKSKIHTGDKIDDVLFTGEDRTKVIKSDDPIIVFGKSSGEVFLPGRVKSMCVQCHDEMKPGELGAIIYLKFSLAKVQNAKTVNLVLEIITLIVVFSLLAILIYVVLNKWVRKPIGKVKKILMDMGKGNFSSRCNFTSHDEIGAIGNAINATIDSLSSMIKDISNYSNNLTGSSKNLLSISQVLTVSAEDLSRRSIVVASKANESTATVNNISFSTASMSELVKNVSTSIEQINASFNDVAQQCSNESRIATRADEEAKKTKEMIIRLETSAKNIGKILDTISAIADQTNLLALNATIEAASAGDAGKGFAVVANEVKALARQTSKATEEIAKNVAEMRGNTDLSVNAIETITKVINDVLQISRTIASAVEVQSKTTGEIAKSVGGASEAAKDVAQSVQDFSLGIGEVSSNVKNLHEISGKTSENALHTENDAKALAEIANKMQVTIGKFRV